MATQPDFEDAQDEDVLELEDVIEPGEADDDTQDAGDDDFVGFADEIEQPKADDDLVKHLRGEIRERNRQLAEARRMVPAEPAIVVGPKPTLEGCAWDAEEYAAERDAWDERKEAADKQAAKQSEGQRAQQEKWAGYTRDYETKKAALRYPDARQVEQVALDTLSPTTQALIVRHADNSALFLYAVGKSKTKLDELERIEAEGDPFAVVKAITKMEATLTTKRSGPRPPDPERVVRGKPIASSGGDKHLAKLRESASKTGDRSAVAAYMAANKDAK